VTAVGDSVPAAWPNSAGGGAAIGSGGSMSSTVGSAQTIYIDSTGSLSYTAGTGYSSGQNAVQVGTGGANVSTGAGVVTLPTVPQNVQANSSNASATLSWANPRYTGKPLSSYQVSSNGGTTWTNVGMATSYTFTGLTNGTAYTLAVRAINADGNGATGTVSVTPAPISPTAPLNVGAMGGNANAGVYWDAPTDNGGAAISSYRVYVSSSPTGPWTLSATTADGSTTGASVTGLANGLTYYFRVTAVNSVGEGAASSVVSVSPATVPSAPQMVQAVAGDGQVTVSWAAPASDGGRPLTDYAVSSDGGSSWHTLGGISTLNYTFTGLSNGTSYIFMVRAYNALSFGDYSVGVEATPMTVPSVPQNLADAPGSGTDVDLSWQAPASDGGSPLTAYIVAQSDDGGLTFVEVATVSVGTLSYTATNLSAGTDYIFSVSAQNSVGTGPAATSSAIPLTVPSAPQNFSLSAGDSQVTLSWAAPASDGGTALTSYQVSNDNGVSWQTIAGASTLSYTFVGLSNGTSYNFAVRAVNTEGPGASASTIATPLAVPGAVQNLVAVPSDGTVTLDWDVPATDGGTPVTDYQVSSDGGSSWTDVASTIQSYTFADLSNGSTYTFAVRAINTVGSGAPTSISAAPLAIPSVPQNLIATAGAGQASLSWAAPADTGGSAITSYSIYSSTDGLNWTPAGTTTASSFSFIVVGLTNGTPYYLAVTADNAAGSSMLQASTAVTVTPMTVPAAPTNLLATAGNAQVSLDWTAPTDDGGSAITGYQISINGGAWTNVAGLTRIFTATALTNGNSYTFAVRALNSVGAGDASDGITAMPEFVATPPPAGLAYFPVLTQGGVWTGTGTVSVSVDGPFAEYLHLIQANGTMVPASNYMLKSGSTIVIFTQAYLNTLANGNYQYRMVFAGGESALINLTINRQSNNNGGGNNNNSNNNNGSGGGNNNNGNNNNSNNNAGGGNNSNRNSNNNSGNSNNRSSNRQTPRKMPKTGDFIGLYLPAMLASLGIAASVMGGMYYLEKRDKNDKQSKD